LSALALPARAIFGGFVALFWLLAAQYVWAEPLFYAGSDDAGGHALRQVLDCQGQKRQLLAVGKPSSWVADFNFQKPTAPAMSYNCAQRTVAPELRSWILGGSTTTSFAFVANAPGLLGAAPSDTCSAELPLRALHATLSVQPVADFAGLNRNSFGAPVQLPLFVVPITIAYDPVYAVQRTANGIAEYRFNLARANRRADGSGGLRLDRAAYCAMFNPLDPAPLRNWNDPRLRQLNAGQSLQDPAEAALGIAFNVPVRLVGRADDSGATLIWTRHLAAACGSSNAYLSGTARLPGMTVSGTNFISGSNPSIDDAEVQGRYLMASGAAAMAQAIDFLPVPQALGARELNGKIGYLEPDQTLPAVLKTGRNTYGLATANLKNGATFLSPSPVNATTAMGNLLPPQSTDTGVYDPVTGSPGNRSDPTAWTEPMTSAARLANPAKGYPIIGTQNMQAYSCHADPDIRKALGQLIGFFAGRIVRDSNNAAIANSFVTDPRFGTLAASGFGALPEPWQRAISETFLVNSAEPGLFADQQPLRFVATGGRMAVAATLMQNNLRMFRQRSPHMLVSPVSEMRIGLMNWLHNSAAEVANANAVTYLAVWIERAATGEVVPVTFNGNRSITLPAGDAAANHLSDAISASRWREPPTANEVFWVHMVGRVPDLAGQRLPTAASAYSDDAVLRRYPLASEAGLPLDTAGPVPSIASAVSSSPGVPVLFIGRYANDVGRSIAVIGDSISAGLGDGARRGLIAGPGYAARASVDAADSAALSVTIMARSGEGSGDFRRSNSRRLQLLAYADVLHLALGTNDIGTGNATSASVIADRLRQIRALVRANQPSIRAITSMPLLGYTSSTDSFASIAGQTPISKGCIDGGVRDQVNAAQRADTMLGTSNPYYLDMLIDTASPVMAASRPSVWNADGRPRTYVADGVHPTTFGHAQMAKAARAAWQSLPLYRSASSITRTLGERQLWIVDGAPGMAEARGSANPRCTGM
jgi:phosphate transport system substrate-binding protein